MSLKEKGNLVNRQGLSGPTSFIVVDDRSDNPTIGHLDEFFALYPAFDYDRASPSTDEFYRMCDFFDWEREDSEREEAHDAFKKALVLQFNELYGTDVDDIESWRGLCRVLDILPLPENLGKAKKVNSDANMLQYDRG